MEIEGGKYSSDARQVSEWGWDAVKRAGGHKSIFGYPGNSLRPAVSANRAEAVTVSARAS
jgi:hypothetical protein